METHERIGETNKSKSIVATSLSLLHFQSQNLLKQLTVEDWDPLLLDLGSAEPPKEQYLLNLCKILVRSKIKSFGISL